MPEHVRIKKTGTRVGRLEMLEDGRTIEGEELAAPTPGLPYLVRRTVWEQEGEPDVFTTSPVRAVITVAGGGITLLTDNSEYSVEVVGH